MFARKLGLRQFEPTRDAALIAELETVLQLAETDMSIFFRRLAHVDVVARDGDRLAALVDAYYVPEQLSDEVRQRIERWLSSYARRVREDGLDAVARRADMDAVNPKFVLRNYLAQLAIDKAHQGDYSMVNELLDVLRTPYAEQPRHEVYAAKRPEWARRRVGCSMLSCSS